MDMRKIQESIFKTVDVIIEKRMRKLQVNYCIAGIIDSDVEYDDKNELFYWVNYQDLRIKAYPISAIHEKKGSLSIMEDGNNIDFSDYSIYKKGDLVYTLIINGDLNKRRLILCKA